MQADQQETGWEVLDSPLRRAERFKEAEEAAAVRARESRHTHEMAVARAELRLAQLEALAAEAERSRLSSVFLRDEEEQRLRDAEERRQGAEAVARAAREETVWWKDEMVAARQTGEEQRRDPARWSPVNRSRSSDSLEDTLLNPDGCSRWVLDCSARGRQPV